MQSTIHLDTVDQDQVQSSIVRITSLESIKTLTQVCHVCEQIVCEQIVKIDQGQMPNLLLRILSLKGKPSCCQPLSFIHICFAKAPHYCALDGP